MSITKSVYKKWWFWAAIAVVISIGVIVFLVTRGPSYAKTNLNGLKVNEACDAAISNGWEIYSVTNGNNEDEKSHCGNTENSVVAYVYMDHIHKVEIWYDGEAAATSEPEPEAEPESTPETETTPAPQQESAQPAQTSSNTNWKQFLAEYESWVNKYVEFMKKYKNASTTDMAAMMNDYSNLLNQQTEWTSKLENLRNDLSGSDLTEYINTLTRVNQKLTEAY